MRLLLEIYPCHPAGELELELDLDLDLDLGPWLAPCGRSSVAVCRPPEAEPVDRLSPSEKLSDPAELPLFLAGIPGKVREFPSLGSGTVVV